MNGATIVLPIIPAAGSPAQEFEIKTWSEGRIKTAKMNERTQFVAPIDEVLSYLFLSLKHTTNVCLYRRNGRDNRGDLNEG